MYYIKLDSSKVSLRSLFPIYIVTYYTKTSWTNSTTNIKHHYQNYRINLNNKARDYIIHTVCPRSSYPFYIVGYYIKWATASWTYSKFDHDSAWNFNFEAARPGIVIMYFESTSLIWAAEFIIIECTPFSAAFYGTVYPKRISAFVSSNLLFSGRTAQVEELFSTASRINKSKRIFYWKCWVIP